MSTGTGGGQWRVDFDAEVVFSNGGALQTQGFRLDIPGDDITDGALGELLVRHLGLLMVGSTRITRKELLQEPHKGSRNTAAAAAGRRTAELTGPATRAGWPTGPAGTGDAGDAAGTGGAGDAGGVVPELAALVDLPVVLVRLLGSAHPVADRLALAPFTLTGHAVLVQTGRAGGPYLTEDAVALLAEQGAALVATDSLEHTGPAAEALAAAGLPAVTGLTGLEALPATGVRLHAVPFPGRDTPSIRVYGVTDDQH
ncbi:cyclase family protein [Streptomyces sp. NPDC051567]|uniref:cyclase family protein n=1 Tax=Streptomyces sp. NPDC051567 TaxID=3365660 RepID=UPI0037AB8352